ncbi:hypothetical protein GC174_04020 [bacterium]|nr:hypothetical protein [bacterium]
MSILSDVVDNISKEVSKVQERSQEMLQGFNINTQIRELERKKTKVLAELGELVVDKHHREKDISEEAIKEKVAEVVGYEDQINILKEELDTVNVQRDPNASRAKKEAAKAGYKSTPGFKCPHCGTPVNREKKFCPACGGSLTGEVNSSFESEFESQAEPASKSERNSGGTAGDGPLDVEPEPDDE